MRLRPKSKPNAELYQVRYEALSLLEEQSQAGVIDLFYGDESSVSEEGYVPYGWQFKDESVHIEVAKGQRLNCFGMISRQNQLHYATTNGSITSAFVVNQLEELSWRLSKPTVIVLDNARIHTSDKVRQRLGDWHQRGLYLFYLPPYSPHLNLAERLWKELKARWLRPEDYQTSNTLFYAVWLALAAVGQELFIRFSDF
ncbi:IS630 family transposase [Spirosoma sp. KUDC1026]|uniref:IS630 family transposase n=1 Tax=Spirosoma sp. KUDC1026 TaxID=2745947 RepID=UPI001E4BE3F2|nr:IS630 family transposase [Spirosoma sp. KUDC1026]